MIDYEGLVGEVVGRVVAFEGKYAQKIAAAILGVEIDSWGDVKSVSPETAKAILSRPEVESAVDKVRQRVAVEAAKPVSAKIVSSMARRIKERLLNDLEEQIYQEIYDSVEDEVKTAIRAKIMADPRLAPYFVAGRIKGVVK